MSEKVFGYIRVSGKGQVDGDGPERQTSAIDVFCLKFGLDRISVFQEMAVSGTVDAMERPQFSSLLENVEHYGITAIVVERLDRLARDLMVSELLLAECRNRNIKVYSADQGQLIDMAADGGDPTRVLIRQIMGALAQWERTMLVRKLAAARKRVKEKTGRCEGPKPYGALPGEARILQLAEDLRAGAAPAPPGYKCDGSFRSIAQLLNDAGFFTRKGTPWSAGTVHNILKGK